MLQPLEEGRGRRRPLRELTCAVEDFELRELGATAVCSYLWAEYGRHRGEQFALAGVATDVLVQRDDRWLLQAHHVSMRVA